MKSLLIAPLFPLLGAAACLGGDWPQYRGPDANTTVPAGDYPTDLTVDGARLWGVDLPGQGSAEPVVWGDAIFLTCEVDGEDTLCRYGLDGQLAWRRSLGPGREAKHRNATGANPTPTTDGERVYAYFKSGLLVAHTLDGDEVWRRNLQDEFGKDSLWWDLGSSPVLTEAGVVVAVIQAGDSYVATFDRQTGEVVWKVPRNYQRPTESDQAYTTPILAETDAGPVLVVFGADHLTAHDPQTGEVRFSSGGFNPQNKGMWRVIGSPVVADGLAVVTYGRGDFTTALRLAGEGDVTDSGHVWTRQGVGADVPSPVVRGDRVYVLNAAGSVECLELATGETVWSDRLPRSRSKYFATPLVAGDLMYCVREDGRGHVCRLGDGLEVVGEIDLEDDTVVTPVPIDGDRLLVRSRRKLQLYGAE